MNYRGINNPKIILADEPTGELDSVNAAEIFGLFRHMVSEEGMSVVATTHDRTLIDMSDQIYIVNNGILELTEAGMNNYDHFQFKKPTTTSTTT